MLTPRPATVHDINTLARIHVQSWRETYDGLLSAKEIGAKTVAGRTALWQKAFEWGGSRVWIIGDFGFAQFGPQREETWRVKGYQEELYVIYLLRSGYGYGHQPLSAAHGPEGKPFTTCVLAGNARACAFNDKTGGKRLTTRSEQIGKSKIKEHVYGWTALNPP